LPRNAFQQEALDAHNKARAEQDRGLSSLKWSAQLQADAQAWADQCKFSHSVPEGQGQNLFMTSMSTASAASAVNSWMKEENYYQGIDGCYPGKVCGHYTQVVWHSTENVGCAMKTCSSVKDQNGKDLGAGTVLVCNYNPAGNIIGQSPFPPRK
jgi:pathogenesis-related protein 1